MTIDSILVIAKKIIDILLVWAILYYILKALRKNMKMILLFKGILIIVAVKILADVLDLVTIGYLIDYVIEWAPLALIIIFQPEIRTALEHLGKTQLLGRHKTMTISERETTVKEILGAAEYLRRMRMGALIVIERDDSLAEYIKKAQPIYADISSSLLASLFFNKNPLHDGGVIIQGDKITSAAAVFPTSDNPSISKRLGTRHRAAIGISEEADCIALVVSEETGRISIAIGGKLFYNLSLEETKIKLLEELSPSASLLTESKEGDLSE
jgi:diadenylate cyclase